MTNEKEQLARNLRNYRRENGINQFEFAEDCGVSLETIGRIERGKSNTTIETMELIAARIGVRLADLFAGIDVTYILVPSQIIVEGTEYTTYGIGAVHDNVMLECIHDISTDYNKVMSLVMKCNEEYLALCHLHDIAEDALL